MYLYDQKRRMGDLSPSDLLANVSAAPISVPVQPVSVSPLLLGGLGLLAFAYVVSGTHKAAKATARKAKAVGRALRA